jgi:cystathionine beta-lyase/cystathionine gamma-synthase
MLSGTKSLSGHSDMLLGNVSVADGELATALRDWRERRPVLSAGHSPAP